MALTQLTQLTGQSGISTTIDYKMSDLVVDTISVAGTITYNDVTSVDSIGIITARKGIKVLADGINVTGISTFNSNTEFSAVAVSFGAVWIMLLKAAVVAAGGAADAVPVAFAVKVGVAVAVCMQFCHQ